MCSPTDKLNLGELDYLLHGMTSTALIPTPIEQTEKHRVLPNS
jgi:hypothetical protein